LLFSLFGLGRKAALTAASLILATFTAAAPPALAQMPEPYVSPTFDAVLMPVTKQVVKQFKLPRQASGAVIVSVEPGGVADLYGLEPGEVITSFGSKKFRRPADLDAMVLKNLKDGPQYLYFEGIRKGKDKRTIIYLEEEDYRRPLPLNNIRSWRSYNAPSFNFIRWYDPYSYYITDIWDYSIYYVDQVIVSDVFITNYYSETNYFYYDYTEISSLEMRQSWVEEENAIYCGDVEGYNCGVQEVGYPVEQDFGTCSGAPGDDWCLPPDQIDGSYCASFPSDPSCSGNTFGADDYCAYNPEDPACGGVVGESFDGGEGTYSDGDYCTQNPDAAECGGGGVAPEYVDQGTGDYVPEEQAYDDPGFDQQSYDDPAYDQQVYDDQPVYEDPAYDQQVYDDQPVYDDQQSYDQQTYDDQQSYDQQSYDEPVYEEPVYEEPVYEEPVYEEPVYEEPVYEEPVYEEPVYEEPVYEEPVYEEPVYEEPAYDGGGGGGECYDEEGNYIC
jgi:hypothetical protein